MRRREERGSSSRHGVRRLPVRLITWTVPMAASAISSRTAGFPDLLHNLVRAKRQGRRRMRLGTNLLSLLRRRLRDLTGIEHKMPWFGWGSPGMPAPTRAVGAENPGDRGNHRSRASRTDASHGYADTALEARSSLHPNVDIPAGGSSRALTRHPGLRIRLSVRGSARSACIPGSGAGACCAPAVVCPGSSVPSRYARCYPRPPRRCAASPPGAPPQPSATLPRAREYQSFVSISVSGWTASNLTCRRGVSSVRSKVEMIWAGSLRALVRFPEYPSPSVGSSRSVAARAPADAFAMQDSGDDGMIGRSNRIRRTWDRWSTATVSSRRSTLSCLSPSPQSQIPAWEEATSKDGGLIAAIDPIESRDRGG